MPSSTANAVSTLILPLTFLFFVFLFLFLFLRLFLFLFNFNSDGGRCCGAGVGVWEGGTLTPTNVHRSITFRPGLIEECTPSEGRVGIATSILRSPKYSQGPVINNDCSVWAGYRRVSWTQFSDKRTRSGKFYGTYN